MSLSLGEAWERVRAARLADEVERLARELKTERTIMGLVRRLVHEHRGDCGFGTDMVSDLELVFVHLADRTRELAAEKAALAETADRFLIECAEHDQELEAADAKLAERTRERDAAVGQLACSMYLLHGDECDDAPCEDDECCWCRSLELLYPAAEEPQP